MARIKSVLIVVVQIVVVVANDSVVRRRYTEHQHILKNISRHSCRKSRVTQPDVIIAAALNAKVVKKHGIDSQAAGRASPQDQARPNGPENINAAPVTGVRPIATTYRAKLNRRNR